MSARDGAAAPLGIGDAPPRSSFRDPSPVQVLQVGLIAWVIFTAAVFAYQLVAEMIATPIGNTSSALVVTSISAVIGLIATLAVGLPSGILLAGSLKQVESPWFHFLAFVGLALLISLAINALFFGGISMPAGLFALAPTGSMAASLCLRWIVFSRSRPKPRRSVQEGSTRG